jgi:2-polyprenyl-3-methyl-5-hydroxy-6-metoxy-1,4-benzoquinol methylase
MTLANHELKTVLTEPPLSENDEYDHRWAKERYSAEYTGYTPFLLNFMAQEVSRIRFDGGAKALEIGCGDGFFSGQLAQLGSE